jgi:hypothetical protein
MSSHTWRLAIVAAAALVPGLAWGQHEGHPATGTPAGSAELTQCLRVQPVIERIITAATARAEAARLSNSPTELRAAIEHLEAALRDVRARSAPCAAAAASSDPHAGHATSSPAPAAKPAPSAKPEGATPEAPKTDPHAGHSPAPSAGKVKKEDRP